MKWKYNVRICYAGGHNQEKQPCQNQQINQKRIMPQSPHGAAASEAWKGNDY